MTNDTSIPPVVKTVTVPLNQDAAFRRFTEQPPLWSSVVFVPSGPF
jgi:hypothetical protein